MKIYEFEHELLGNIIKYKILVGQNAKDNWKILDDSAPEDLWFHLADYTSCHVVIQKIVLEVEDTEENINYNPEIIIVGANYCKEHSKYKNNKNIKVIYTKVKNIKKGKEQGSVYTKNEKYIIV
jgi:predicted ribosome quality control (RQC) complex YloA/Tae2 family protein